jgi:hypothetical protein
MMTTNEERIETNMDDIQEKKDVNLREIIVEMKDGQEVRMAGQEARGGQSIGDGAKSRRKGGHSGVAGES